VAVKNGRTSSNSTAHRPDEVSVDLTVLDGEVVYNGRWLQRVGCAVDTAPGVSVVVIRTHCSATLAAGGDRRGGLAQLTESYAAHAAR
jgi:hypothetical protein